MFKKKSIFRFLALFIPGVCMALDALADYISTEETKEEMKELITEEVDKKVEEKLNKEQGV